MNKIRLLRPILYGTPSNFTKCQIIQRSLFQNSVQKSRTNNLLRQSLITRTIKSTNPISNQGLKPTKHDMSWYFKNASGAAFIGMGAAIFIMTCVSGSLAYFGFSKTIIPYFENYKGSNSVIIWFRDHLQPTREKTKHYIQKSGLTLSQSNIDLIISTFLIYILLKPIKIPLFLKLTHSIAMKRIARDKCIDTYVQHKNYGKQIAKDRYVLFSDKFGIKKKTKKDPMASAYNHYKLRARRIRNGLEDNKMKIKEKVKENKEKNKEKLEKVKDRVKENKEKVKDKVKENKEKVKEKVKDKVDDMKDKIPDKLKKK